MSGLWREPSDQSGYLSEGTIAAVSTAVGGAVAIIRVSGPKALQATGAFAGEAFIQAARLEPRKLFNVTLRNQEGQVIDRALAVYFAGPRSLTGEDCVELQIHGGSFLATSLMRGFAELGVRQALPGEFSFRAVRNGKMTISQAEATADLIAASNDSAAALALEKMSGTQHRLLVDVVSRLKQLVTQTELGIDFSDQDVEELGFARLQSELTPIVAQLETLGASYGRGMRLQEGVRIAFVGLPNAGKSSFFNALLGEDRAIVSEIAGTTRDVIREKMTLRGSTGSVTLRLEDTAGLQESEDPVEKIGISKTRKAAREADAVILVVDGTAGSAETSELLDEWRALGVSAGKAIGILTKCDLISESRSTEVMQALQPFGAISWTRTSAKTGSGVGEAARRIADFCEGWVTRNPGEVLLTRQEDLRAVQEAITHLVRAQSATEMDLLAADLRHAIYSLRPLTGEGFVEISEDVLNRIFTQFCIGK